MTYWTLALLLYLLEILQIQFLFVRKPWGGKYKMESFEDEEGILDSFDLQKVRNGKIGKT